MFTGLPVGGPSSRFSTVMSAPVKPFSDSRSSSRATADERERSALSTNSIVTTDWFDGADSPVPMPPMATPTEAL